MRVYLIIVTVNEPIAEQMWRKTSRSAIFITSAHFFQLFYTRLCSSLYLGQSSPVPTDSQITGYRYLISTQLYLNTLKSYNI